MMKRAAIPCVLLGAGLVAAGTSVLGAIIDEEEILGWSGHLGAALSLLVLPSCCMRLPEPFRQWRYTLTLAAAGLMLCGISFATSCSLFSIPAGSVIRPMLWSAEQFLLLFTGVGIAALLGPWNVKGKAPRWLQWLGIALCLAPFLIGEIMFRRAVAQNGLILGD